MADSDQARNLIERKGVTAETLRRCLEYDPETGVFRRRAALNRAVVKHLGRSAGFVNCNGYWIISIGVPKFRAHQLAWLYMTGVWPDRDIDHINGIRTDNRWSNLRLATRSQNLWNAKMKSHNMSGFKGVGFDSARGKWKAQIRILGKQTSLGRFDTPEAAAEAYRVAAEKNFGEFARTE